MPEKKTYYCEKCNRTMNASEFYMSNNLEKYPDDGKFPMCKKCMTMHVDNFNPDTYMWILEEADVPYIPVEWNKLMATYGKDKSKLTGTTIVGRYLGKMKLKQFRDYRWKDTEFLQEKANAEIAATMKRQGYDAQQIAEAIDKATFTLPEEILKPNFDEPAANPFLATGNEDYFAEQAGVAADIDLGLTDEEITHLRLKWGKTYRPEEWVQLEQLYQEMMESYDIQSAGHIDTLKMVCKTSLKANQLIDLGDVDGAQKAVKMYDMLMKSGKFTAAQNKAEKGEFVDSIGELVALCEKEGFIPRYYVGEPNDKVDETIKDMQRYTNTLVTEELNLGNLIETAIKQNQREDEAALLQDDSDFEDEDVIAEIESELHDNDFEEYNDFIENETLDDEEAIRRFLEQEGEW